MKQTFRIIHVNKKNVNLYYDTTNGFIIDKINNKIIYKLKKRESSYYYYFKLEFDTFKYKTIYQPKTQTYKKIVCGSIYNFNIYLNLVNLIKNNIDKCINQIISYYLTIIQIRQFKSNKKYLCDNILLFLQSRIDKNIKLIPWNFFALTDRIAFDLKNKNFVDSKNSQNCVFKKRGCIIETNNIIKLINDIENKIPPEKTLIIIPTGMINYWSNNNVINFDKLLKSAKNNFKNLELGDITSIIIHECYIQYIPLIKNVMNNTPLCEYIWMVNTLPLKYYISSKDNIHGKFNVNNLSKLTNIWANFTTDNKKSSKTELIKFLTCSFNEIYIKYNYALRTYNIKSINLTNFESSIYQTFNKFYFDWKSKLSNDKNNIYSFSTKQKNYDIESRIYDSVLTLCMSVIPDIEVQNFFSKYINKILSANRICIEKINELQQNYKTLRKTSYQKFNDKSIIDFKYIIKDLSDNKNKILTSIKNREKYLTKGFYDAYTEEKCPVCYSDDMINTKLICGHNVCLECTLNILPNTKSCPLCAESININKMVIIRDSIPEYTSNIVKFFDKIHNNNTIIVSDLFELSNLLQKNLNILNINDFYIVEKIFSYHDIEKIIIVTLPKHLMRNYNVYNFAHYFENINPNIKIIVMEVTMF
ncbi:putative ring finger protein [Cotonvirus japonicus]|uniref:Ring finger protein n=1 Tax=Cotonvirus japonicus TaxID=2811091 RepID=A0ABM7NSY6_9VIRU|nr:putative ring finger protein [Cotonvirus japonicus]BCS83275.1 putative ring finger protein [Cotonvirus japonicus]